MVRGEKKKERERKRDAQQSCPMGPQWGLMGA